jgi:hypothetical protein
VRRAVRQIRYVLLKRGGMRHAERDVDTEGLSALKRAELHRSTRKQWWGGASKHRKR